MVASPNPHFTPQDDLASLLHDMRRRLGEIERQVKYPFSVSHGGVADFTVLPNPNGTGSAVVSLYDGFGNLVVGTDAAVGYGLAAPETQVPMYQTTPGVTFQTASSATSTYTGQLVLVNSCFLMQWRMTSQWASGAGMVGSSYVKLTDSGTGWSWRTPTVNSAVVSTTTPSLRTCGPFAFQLPETEIGQRVSVDIFAWVSTSPGGNNGVAVTPLMMVGTSLAVATPWLNAST